MKTYQMLVYILITIFVFNTCSCSLYDDVNYSPESKFKMEMSFDENIVNVGYIEILENEYIWCQLDNNEINIIDYEGNLVEDFCFEEEIIDTNSYRSDKVVVATSGGKLYLLSYTDNEYKMELLYEFNDEIKSVSIYDYYTNDYQIYILMNDGLLCSYKENENLEFIANDVNMLFGVCAIFNDNQILNIPISKSISINPQDEIICVYDARACTYVETTSGFYRCGFLSNSIETVYENEEFKMFSNENGTIRIKEKNVLYTGMIDGGYKGKGVPFVEDALIKNMPDDYYYYYPLIDDIVCYKDETLVLYHIIG